MTTIHYYGFIIIIIIIILFLYLLYTPSYTKSNNISSLMISINEAKSRRFDVIIDVRTSDEREILGYYPNSIPVSLDKLEQLPIDISNKNAWILVYSNGDERALYASDMLYKMGYRNVRYIKETYLRLMPGSS